MGWLDDILRAGRILPARSGWWTVNGFRESETRSLVSRNFRDYADAWAYFCELRDQRRADIIEIYRPDGGLFWNWSKYEQEG